MSKRYSRKPDEETQRQELEHNNQDLEITSHFISPLALSILRFTMGAIALLFIAYHCITEKLLPLNYLIFWNWVGLFLYFMIGGYNSLVDHYDKNSLLKVQSFFFNVLFSTVFNISFLASIWYFSYEYFQPNPMFFNLPYVNYIAHGLNIVMVLMDAIMSRISFEKAAVWYAGFVFLLYEHAVWFTHYILQWPWPSNIYETTFRMDGEAVYIAAFIMVSIAAVIGTAGIQFLVINIREQWFLN